MLHDRRRDRRARSSARPRRRRSTADDGHHDQHQQRVSDTLAQSAVSSILGAAGGFGGFGAQIGDTIFGAIINAVKSDTTSNLLQVAARRSTLDNQEAHILVGQEIPITTGQALSTNFDNAFRTVQRQNVGIQLEVRPQINAGGAIKLYLRQEVSSIAGPVSSDNSDLILNKREIETTRDRRRRPDRRASAGCSTTTSAARSRRSRCSATFPVLGELFRSQGAVADQDQPDGLHPPDDPAHAPRTAARLTEQRYGYLRAAAGRADAGREPSIDELVRDYMGAAPPIPSAPIPGNIEDPRDRACRCSGARPRSIRPVKR